MKAFVLYIRSLILYIRLRLLVGKYRRLTRKMHKAEEKVARLAQVSIGMYMDMWTPPKEDIRG